MFHFFHRISQHQQGFLLVILATLLFSTKGIFIKMAYVYQIQPAVLMFIRMMIALPFYLAVFFGQHQVRATQTLTGRSILCMMLLGIVGYYLSSYLDLTGLLYLPASLERLVLYSYPSIVVLLSVVFLGRALEKNMIASLLLIYAGLFTVFIRDIGSVPVGGSQQLLGALLVFAAAASFAVYLLGSEVMMRQIPSALFTAVAMISASVAIFIHYLLNFEVATLFSLPLMVYVYGAVIAIFCTVLPSFMLSSGVRRVGAATGSAVGSLGPVVTLVMAVVFLQEQVSISQVLGFVLVIGGVSNLGCKKNNKKKIADI